MRVDSRDLRRRARRVLLSGAGIFGLCWTMASFAENAAPDAASGAGANPASATASTNDIVVTAQRRSENLKDVPISVSVVTPAQMASQGITSSQDLTRIVPSLNISVKGSYVQPVLRGVSSLTTGLGNDPAIPIYFDGLYLALAGSNFFDLADVSNVQVLKGPQGTLYGRNATGGVILISTRAPSFEPEGEVSLSYARFDDVRASGFVSGGLIPDLLAVSASGFYRQRDGYFHNILTGNKMGDLENYAARIKLLLTPFDGGRFTLSAFQTSNDDLSPYGQFALNGNSLSRLVAPNLPIATRPYDVSPGQTQRLSSRTRSVSLTGEFETAIGTITSLTGWQHAKAEVADDVDAGPALVLQIVQPQRNRTLSQELTLASKEFGPVSFVTGMLYYHQRGTTKLRVNSVQNIDGRVVAEAFAYYLQVQLSVTDRLKLIGGARYSDEARRYDGGFSLGDGVPTVPIVTNARATWNQITPRATIQYDVTDNINFYASYSRGFKSGIFNDTGLSPVPVDPEKVRAYEIGAKAAWRGASLNVALYDYKLSNLQVSSVFTDANGVTSALTTNAAAAKSRGVDVDASIRLNPHFQLSGGLAYNDSKYTSFPNASVNVPIPAGGCAAAGAPFPCGNMTATTDARGNPLPRAPKLTLTGTVNYTTELAGGELNASATYYHNSGFSWEVANRVREDAYDTLSAQVAWRPAGSGLEFAVFGTNLTNSLYSFAEVDSVAGDTVAYAPPRTVGGRVSFRF